MSFNVTGSEKMAEMVPKKSRGLKFAEQQLLRHGWEHGKGLGRAENGISEAIKVKVKCDKGGVGHKEGEQFTFHWWDHVFNKASAKLQVESDDNGIKLKKTAEEDDDDNVISNKKPRKASLAKAKLYGCFVKSATLLSGQEQPEPQGSLSDDDSSTDEDDDQRLDLSSTTKVSDADLMKACGGRTAHKGARHGLTMSAKLARLEQQEAEFMAKYGNGSRPQSDSKPAPLTLSPSGNTAEEAQKKKKKKKKKKKTPADSICELNGSEASGSPDPGVTPKKKKKKKSKCDKTTDEISSEDLSSLQNSETDCSHRKKKKKRKNRTEESQEEETGAGAEDQSPENQGPENQSPEERTELHDGPKKKKKKKEKRHYEEEESLDAGSSQSEHVGRSKKIKAAVLLEEAEVGEDESVSKQKRTKCKKGKSTVVDGVDDDAPPPKKKKKKNSKQ